MWLSGERAPKARRQEHAVCSSNTKGPVWMEDSKGGGGEKGIVSHIGPCS